MAGSAVRPAAFRRPPPVVAPCRWLRAALSRTTRCCRSPSALGQLLALGDEVTGGRVGERVGAVAQERDRLRRGLMPSAGRPQPQAAAVLKRLPGSSRTPGGTNIRSRPACRFDDRVGVVEPGQVPGLGASISAAQPHANGTSAPRPVRLASSSAARDVARSPGPARRVQERHQAGGDRQVGAEAAYRIALDPCPTWMIRASKAGLARARGSTERHSRPRIRSASVGTIPAPSLEHRIA